MKKAVLIIIILICVGVLAFFGVRYIKSEPATTSESAATTLESKPSTEPADNTEAAASTAAAGTITETKSDDSKAAETTSDKKTSNEKVEIGIDSATVSAGKTITLPIELKTVPVNGISSCNFSLLYDTNVFEAVEVSPGKIIKGTADLEYSVNTDKGLISFLFINSDNEKDLITKPGVFANIKLTSKKDAKKGDAIISKYNEGAFGDKDLNKVTAIFNDGKVTIK